MSEPLFSTLERSRTVSLNEAAIALGVATKTLRRWAKAGRLTGIAFQTPGTKGRWKFKRAELEVWYQNLTSVKSPNAIITPSHFRKPHRR